MADQAKRALQVDLYHLVEFDLVDLKAKLLGDVGGSVVYQYVDAAELLGGGVNQGLNLIGFTDVAYNRLDALANFFGYLIQRFLLAATDHDFCALADKDLRDGLSNPAAGAGHDGDFVLKDAH